MANTPYPKYAYYRYHRFHKETGEKQIKRFLINEVPQNNDTTYSDWKRGHGPMSPEHYERVVSQVRKAVLGKPKSPETKAKMRDAKLGKPKTLEHRRNMSKGQKASIRAKIQAKRKGIVNE